VSSKRKPLDLIILRFSEQRMGIVLDPGRKRLYVKSNPIDNAYRIAVDFG
jgi:hypothetical protein